MVLLQAISEQDPRFVVTNLVGEQKVRFCARTAAEARQFCNSPEFEKICKLIHFPTERRHHPERAARALDDLRSSRSMKQWHSKKGHNVEVPEEQDEELLFQTASSSAEVCNC
jgi:hypothetical protein